MGNADRTGLATGGAKNVLGDGHQTETRRRAWVDNQSAARYNAREAVE
jgi:hypothetical protein